MPERLGKVNKWPGLITQIELNFIFELNNPQNIILYEYLSSKPLLSVGVDVAEETYFLIILNKYFYWFRDDVHWLSEDEIIECLLSCRYIG